MRQTSSVSKGQWPERIAQSLRASVSMCVRLFGARCIPRSYFSMCLGANASPSHPLLSDFILVHFWSQAFCFLFSTREPESGPQKNKAELPTGNVCSGGEFGGWRQAGQDLCQWNVIWGGSCRSLNCWQPAREQLDAFWAVCVCVQAFFPSCKQSPGDVETEALGRN